MGLQGQASVFSNTNALFKEKQNTIMNIHPTHSETYWEVVLVDTMFKRCENDLLDRSGRKKLSMCMNIHECSSWRWRRGCRGVLAELCEDVCMYSTSCTVVTLGAIRLRSILTDRPVAMLSESGWNAIQVCYAIKKKKRETTSCHI